MFDETMTIPVVGKKCVILPFLVLSSKTVLNKTKQLARIHKHLVCLLESLYKKLEFENKQYINISHPKVRGAVECFIDGFYLHLRDFDVTALEIVEVKEALTKSMEGFRDTMDQRLSRPGFSRIEYVTDPLVKEFNHLRTSPEDDVATQSTGLEFEAESFYCLVNKLVINEELSLNLQCDKIQRAMVSLFPLLIKDLKDESSNFDTSDLATRALRTLVDLQNALYKRQELETQDGPDLRHTKIQASFDLVAENIVKSMRHVEFGEELIRDIMVKKAEDMIGFEDTLEEIMEWEWDTI